MAPRTLRGLLDQDAARRRQKAAEIARISSAAKLIWVQNRVTAALLDLDDPRDALAVVERVGRSIREHLAVRAKL
jgi:hypothetical protein